MQKNIKVCHFTSVHTPLDVRIYLKECSSLNEAGYEVYLVAQGENKIKNGIKIIGCGMPKSRMERMLFFSHRVYEKAKKLDCDIYHFHDPELLPYALKLKRKGKKVIFDSHEDVPSQILNKPWIPPNFRRIISGIYRKYETHIIKQLDAVVAATPHIAKQFKNRARNVVIVNNYPKLEDVVFHDNPFEQRKAIICYAGGISEVRGEQVMVEAMKNIDGILMLAGDHDKETRENVNYLGHIGREEINELYGKAVVGLVLLLPTASYIYSLPIKMFEYMAAGIPFVASDFPLWKKIVNKYNCGICVPVRNQEKIQEAITYLLSHRKEAEEMGRNGRKAVEEMFNWGHEKVLLVKLYEKLSEEEELENDKK